jgi:VWFA-related protein
VSLWAAALAGTAGADAPGDEPRKSDLVERAESRLTQVEVSVTGPAELIADLQPEDFKLKVNLTSLPEFFLDRDCPPAVSAEPGLAGGDPAAPAPVRPVSYLFYFDQPHLTLGGRHQALHLARQLVPRLLRGSDRAMIVSNARRLTVVQELTDDRERLLQALERLELDREQWDTYATEEQERVGRVVEALNDEELSRAVSIARTLQREEQWAADKALRRLEVALVRLAGLDSHKAAIYFADTMRSNAGEHYLSFFGNIIRAQTPVLHRMSVDALAAGIPFERVINLATARGVRFYPVEAQGLVSPFDQELPDLGAVARAGGASGFHSGLRFQHAADTLASLATETGGRVFRTGRRAAAVAGEILGDFSCVYTISFDPRGFAEDAPLRVVVEPLREGVAVRVKGRVVIESESTRLASRLLNAFATEGAADLGIRANLVPTGFDKGAYSALLQVSVPGSALADAQWEMGASTISADRVLDEVSGWLSVGRPGVPLVLESEVRLPPGPHEIVAVARESASDLILSDHFRIDWPDPDGQPATCAPVALVQPVAAAFLRDGESRTSGSLARSEGDAARTDLPTALLGLVCRGRRHQGALRVERALVGASRVEFPVLEFDSKEHRCAQIRDLIPPGSLGPGYYRYVVRVARSDETLHETDREFFAVDPSGEAAP